jgi:hypothetical protein
MAARTNKEQATAKDGHTDAGSKQESNKGQKK